MKTQFRNCLSEIVEALKNDNFQKTKKSAQTIQSETQLLGSLLYEQLTYEAESKNESEKQQAWRQYIAILTECVLIGYDKLEKEEDNRFWWKHLSHRRIDFSKDKQAILNFQEWLKMVIAREEGKLPAWEGIRIVQEQL